MLWRQTYHREGGKPLRQQEICNKLISKYHDLEENLGLGWICPCTSLSICNILILFTRQKYKRQTTHSDYSFSLICNQKETSLLPEDVRRQKENDRKWDAKFFCSFIYPKGFPPIEEKEFGVLGAEYLPADCWFVFKDPNIAPSLPNPPTPCALQWHSRKLWITFIFPLWRSYHHWTGSERDICNSVIKHYDRRSTLVEMLVEAITNTKDNPLFWIKRRPAYIRLWVDLTNYSL